MELRNTIAENSNTKVHVGSPKRALTRPPSKFLEVYYVYKIITSLITFKQLVNKTCTLNQVVFFLSVN